MSRTSATSCAICEDEVEGGGPGRSRATSVGVIIQASTLPKFGSIGGRGGVSRLFQGISPRAAAASASACHCARVAGRRGHAVAARAGHEDGGHRASEREAGGDVARRSLARLERGLALLARPARDLLDRGREQQPQHLGRDAGEHGVLRGIRGQIGRRHERLDRPSRRARARAGCTGTCSTRRPSAPRTAPPSRSCRPAPSRADSRRGTPGRRTGCSRPGRGRCRRRAAPAAGCSARRARAGSGSSAGRLRRSSSRSRRAAPASGSAWAVLIAASSDRYASDDTGAGGATVNCAGPLKRIIFQLPAPASLLFAVCGCSSSSVGMLRLQAVTAASATAAARAAAAIRRSPPAVFEISVFIAVPLARNGRCTGSRR